MQIELISIYISKGRLRHIKRKGGTDNGFNVLAISHINIPPNEHAISFTFFWLFWRYRPTTGVSFCWMAVVVLDVLHTLHFLLLNTMYTLC
jgi:hypothetical protein